MADIKPGWQTTEFWLVVATNLLAIGTAVQGALPAKYAIVIMAALNGFYNFMRTIAKNNSTPPTTPPATPPAA